MEYTKNELTEKINGLAAFISSLSVNGCGYWLFKDSYGRAFSLKFDPDEKRGAFCFSFDNKGMEDKEYINPDFLGQAASAMGISLTELEKSLRSFVMTEVGFLSFYMKEVGDVLSSEEISKAGTDMNSFVENLKNAVQKIAGEKNDQSHSLPEMTQRVASAPEAQRRHLRLVVSETM
jgi:hypothetical protein